MKETASVIQIIQLMIAPAVLINACGLLILGISNKFSVVLNRIRLLNDEKRRLMHTVGERNLNAIENQRLASVTRQLERLVHRAKLIRNSLTSYIVAVSLFVVCSLLIGTQAMTEGLDLRYVILSVFLVGIVSVLVAMVFTLIDVLKGFQVVEFEVMVEE